MVGKTTSFSFHGLRERLQHSISHESHESSIKDPLPPPSFGRHVPLIASPLDPKVTKWLQTRRNTSEFTLKRRPTIAQYQANQISGGLFRKQHEASTLELFFDLFFVANLTVFTNNHEHSTGKSLSSYVGFFAILWSTWFNISIFDVRFYVDSLLNRFFKLVTFGIFISFMGLDPVYETINEGGSTRAFQGIALVLMTSRLMLLLQYASVLWFVRPFKKTVLPLFLMMVIYLAAAMGFLATYLTQENSVQDSRAGLEHVAIWYGIIGAEAILTISVSIFWRVLSFKHTHLVERVGLLTLIIMGEGIIGLNKSIAYLISGTQTSIWSLVGTIMAAVALIYLVYLLYFRPIEHDRFGTIRQQIWTLLHFPLHVALLLTEEGSAVTILWSEIIGARQGVLNRLPSIITPSNAFSGSALNFTSTTEWVEFVNSTMEWTANTYNYVSLEESYDWTVDLESIANISTPYGNNAWNDEVAPILSTMVNGVTNFLFENFNFEVSKKVEEEQDPNVKVEMYFDAYLTTFTFFYAAAGALVLLLAIMFWIGKNHKTKEEYAAIVTRTVVGIVLICLIVIPYKEDRSNNFIGQQAGWLIGIVTFCYLFLVLSDNYIVAWKDWRADKQKRNDEENDLSTTEKGLHNDSTDETKPTTTTRPKHIKDQDENSIQGDERDHLNKSNARGHQSSWSASRSNSNNLTQVNTARTSTTTQRTPPDDQSMSTQMGVENKPFPYVTFDEPTPVSPISTKLDEIDGNSNGGVDGHHHHHHHHQFNHSPHAM